MAPLILKPENALKRAEELILVGQPQVALQSLHELIISKRNRSNQMSLENILLRYIVLAVDMRKGKMAREALTQYRNTCQHVNIHSLEVVIKKFIELAEEKVSEARAKANETFVDHVEDLDEIETPESILMRTVCGDDTKDRTDRDVVMPWLRFLWEVYRIALDTLRNNNKLEALYQSTTHQAFEFCSKYARKVEFRRLCEILRNHLMIIMKSGGPGAQNNAIQLSNADSLQVQTEIRFNQLNTAISLEIWQESFRSVEDIHGLLVISKRPTKPSLMINYYECLVKIFQMSGNVIFHAAAWNKLLSFVMSQNKSVSEEQLSKMCASSLLAALSIPLNNATGSKDLFVEMTDSVDNHQSKDWKLTSLLGLSKVPTRDYLIKEAISKQYWAVMPQEVKDLYDLVELQFSPHTLIEKYTGLISVLSKNEDFRFFSSTLQHIVLYRFLEQLSRVYSTLSFSKLLKLTRGLFSKPGLFELESFLLRESRMGEFDIRLDHQHQVVFIKMIEKSEQARSTDLLLTDSMSMKSSFMMPCTGPQPCGSVDVASSTPFVSKLTKLSVAELKAKIEEEHRMLLKRADLIEKRKEQLETLLLKKEKEEAHERASRLQLEMEQEKQRRAEETKRREQERLRKEREEIQKEEKRKIADEVNRKLAAVGKKIDVEELLDLDRHEIIRQQARQLEEGKKEVEKKAQAIAKRMDHLERAYRLEERPLLANDYELQKAKDQSVYNMVTSAKLAATKAKNEQQLLLCERAKIFSVDAEAFLSQWKATQKKQFAAKKEEYAKLLQEAKEERRKAILEQRYQAALEEERGLKEAEERQDMEDKKAIELAAKTAADEERQRKLDLQFQKQKEREREIEERLQRSTGRFEPIKVAAPTMTRPLASSAPLKSKTPEEEEAQRKLDIQLQKQKEREREIEERLRASSSASTTASGPAKDKYRPPTEPVAKSTWRR